MTYRALHAAFVTLLCCSFGAGALAQGTDKVAQGTEKVAPDPDEEFPTRVPFPTKAESAPLPAPPAEEEEPLVEVKWDSRWRRASWLDAGIIAGGGGVFLADMLLIPPEHEADWDGPVLFDTAMRDAVRRKSVGTRGDIARVSDVMMVGSLVHNLVFDNLVVALLLHDEPDVAWQMTVINTEAYSVAFGLTSLVKRATGRARPYVSECATDPDYSPDCNTESDYRSFFSGHATTTAVGAGLLCAHHLNMPLYDSGPLDVGTCAMGIALTVVTGALRIASDNHWATDVAMGHLVGFGTGFLIPTFFFYTEDEPTERQTVVLPSASEDGLGLKIIGRL